MFFISTSDMNEARFHTVRKNEERLFAELQAYVEKNSIFSCSVVYRKENERKWRVKC